MADVKFTGSANMSTHGCRKMMENLNPEVVDIDEILIEYDIKSLSLHKRALLWILHYILRVKKCRITKVH